MARASPRFRPSRFDPVLPDVRGRRQAVGSRHSAGTSACPFANTLEIEVLGNRIDWAKRYVAANPLNRFVSNPADAWLGIVAGGHDMQQVLEALRVLGLDARAARRSRRPRVEARRVASARPRRHPRAGQRHGDDHGLRRQDRLPRIACSVHPVRHGECAGGHRQGRPRRQAVDHPLRRARPSTTSSTRCGGC